MNRKFLALFLTVLIATPGLSYGAVVTVPPGTPIYGQFDELVSSDPDRNRVGDIVSGSVWKDVVVDGHTVIAAGAPMILRLSSVQKRRVAGRKGELTVAAVSVTAVDGTEVLLTGEYAVEGRRRIVLAGALGGLVAWPLVFIKGKDAVLEPSTVFDAATDSPTSVTVPDGRRS